MIRPGTVWLLATLAATGTSAASVSSVAAQAVAEPESRSLSAAVEEARGSPFHAHRAAPSTEGLGSPPGDPIAAVGLPATLAGAPADDTTDAPANLSRVFLASWGAAAVSQLAGLGLLFGAAYGPPGSASSLRVAAAFAAPLVVPAVGAVLAGAPTGAALGGSLPGLAAGIGAGAAVAGMVGGDSIASVVALLAASSAAHAWVITLFTSWAEYGYR